MSRVGSRPIELPSGVEVKIAGGRVRVKGPKGELDEPLVARTQIELSDGTAVVKRDSDDKTARANHGLMRSLLANMVTGVTAGFEKGLEIVGVGYRAEAKGRELTLSPTKLAVSGISKQKVGQFTAEIRRVRSPEPYKGKGIRYVGEQVRRKAGKAAVGA